MTEKQLLEQYYNERLKLHYMPPFDELSESYIKVIKDSYGFAFYKLGQALKTTKEEILKAFNLN